ncbi:MAG: HD domain-containing protein [archaeon]|jgi:putative nucleotidyltransferase with HDIG domain|nr:HD domain-containing protein [archaeon]
MNIPSREQALELLKKYKMPEHIVEHSTQVAKVAIFLGKKISENGEEVNLPLIEAAALLHDIAKKISIDNPEKRHVPEAVEILKKERLPEIAQIAGEHGLSNILEGSFSSIESKIVYYADKRVKHGSIVSLEERFEYLIKRYSSVGKGVNETILACKPKVFELEKKLLEKANIGPNLEGLD